MDETLETLETLEILASWAPGLHEAFVGPGEGDLVIIDGTLIPTAADEPYHSQKHEKHGMKIQVVARPDGTPLWFSRATPGRTHDLTAARAHGIVQVCLTRQILVLADRTCQGAGATFRTPYYYHHEQPQQYQQFNHDPARLQVPANLPSPNSKPGGCYGEPAVPFAASAKPSKPSTRC